MSAQFAELANIVQTDILSDEGVTRFSPNRRFATVFSDGGPADSVFFLESGLVKIYKRDPEGKEIILDIALPGELFGEQALGTESNRAVSAEILQEGVIHIIPRDVFSRVASRRPELWALVSQMVIARKRKLEKKIELLCLKDVEYRILYYLADLAKMIGPERAGEGEEISVPLSQGELASLIGATRETTSTTLNSLARRGLVRLGRRQMLVPSVDLLQAAAQQQINQVARV